MQRRARSTSGPAVLGSTKAYERAIAELCANCKHMRKIHARTGTPPLRDFTADFAGLCRIVVGQQLSASSAAAIWGRLFAALHPFDASRVLSCSDEQLRAQGLSAAKIKTLRALAAASASGGLDFDRLNEQADVEITSALTALHGIGPWTAEIYLLFALRRADAFPAGDLALQLSAQDLFRLDDKPTAPQLTRLAQRWQPHRGAAARLLWAHYASMRESQPKAARPRPSTAKS